MNLLKIILIGLAIFAQEQNIISAQDMDVCKVFSTKTVEIFFQKENFDQYCCKDCCYVSIVSPGRCQADYCNNLCRTAGAQNSKNQCTISEIDGSYSGCGENYYCDFVEENSVNAFLCQPKLINSKSSVCTEDKQCLSGRCSGFTDRENFCYSCIAVGLKTVPEYGSEMTRRCNQAIEWCDNTKFTCEPKQENGVICNGNNYMCKSGLCQPLTNQCGICKTDNDCPIPSQHICVNGLCMAQLFKNGEKCVTPNECQSGFCLNGTCNGNQPINAQCNNNNDCLSGICDELQRCLGQQIIVNNTNSSNTQQNTTQEQNFQTAQSKDEKQEYEQKQMISKIKQYAIIGGTVAILLLIMMILIFACKKKSVRKNTKINDDQDDLSKQLKDEIKNEDDTEQDITVGAPVKEFRIN